ncbi:MAG: hypothetical protein HQK55_12150 [Deltaproteobacteria bacterium]|nr:hypothetical protein [Deltaproteobacteria bacterium]
MTIYRALYFPYSDINQVRLARALKFFSEIIVYRLPGDQQDQWLSKAEIKALLTRMDFNFFSSPSEFKKNMAGLSHLADVYHDPASLALLKHYHTDDDESSETKLAASIRAQASDRPPETDPRRNAQVCLALAQEFDRQQQEVNDILDVVHRDEQTLSELIGVDNDPELFDWPLPPSSAPTLDHRGRMMTQRLMAWANVYTDLGPFDTALFTDQAEAISTLDQNLARLWERESTLDRRSTEIMEPFIETSIPCRPEDLSLENMLDNRSLPTAWIEFLTPIGARTWRREDLADLRREAAAVSSTLESSGQEASGPCLTLTGYLLPGRNLLETIHAAAGLTRKIDDRNVYCGPVFFLRPAKEGS